jgi:hypothetical protein
VSTTETPIGQTSWSEAQGSSGGSSRETSANGWQQWWKAEIRTGFLRGLSDHYANDGASVRKKLELPTLKDEINSSVGNSTKKSEFG